MICITSERLLQVDASPGTEGERSSALSVMETVICAYMQRYGMFQSCLTLHILRAPDYRQALEYSRAINPESKVIIIVIDALKYTFTLIPLSYS